MAMDNFDTVKLCYTAIFHIVNLHFTSLTTSMPLPVAVLKFTSGSGLFIAMSQIE